MINLKPVYDGNFVIDVSEWNNLRDIYRKFMCKKGDATIQLQLYDAFIAFLDWFIQYCNANIGNKSYSYDDVSPQIFIVEVKKKGQWESYLRYSLYTSRLYAEHVKKILKKEHIERYDNLISVLEADLEWLIINFERHCCKENRNILMCSHSRKNAYSFDVLMLTERIFNIEEVPELIDVDFFSLKPNILFLIRQLLEIVGKDLIGFMSICDENGNPSHQFTQVAWTFLSEKEKDKSKRWNISLPVKCSTIQKINAWTNSFVHAGRFNMIWQQYYALEIVGALMKPSTNYIRECNGNCRQSMMFGDFKIEGYYWMKKDFEEYVYKGAQRIKSPRVIWNDIEKIGAYMS